jgi:hypothetical protein
VPPTNILYDYAYRPGTAWLFDALAVRADGPSRPCGARQILTSIRLDAENPACSPCAMMHAPPNSKLQRNRLAAIRLLSKFAAI